MYSSKQTQPIRNPKPFSYLRNRQVLSIVESDASGLFDTVACLWLDFDLSRDHKKICIWLICQSHEHPWTIIWTFITVIGQMRLRKVKTWFKTKRSYFVARLLELSLPPHFVEFYHFLKKFFSISSSRRSWSGMSVRWPGRPAIR